MTTEEEKKLEYLQALQAKLELQQCLPHLYGWKWYKWAKLFFESTNRYNFLVAANQISKSSTQIRKCIHWATEKSLWPTLWPTPPNQFWYFYPSFSVVETEIKEKWIKEFLPRGKYKDDPIYGWEYVKNVNKSLYSLEFKSGVTVYFKSYEQQSTMLQTSSVHAMFVDEELPEHLFDELNPRISSASIQGHFHMVFTATLGQNFWRETMEEKGESERFKDAFKQNITLYDCLTYEDGSKSLWTKKMISDIKASCRSEAEVQRRVYGRFVVAEDLKYQEFVRSRHVAKEHHLPKSWMIFAGVDIGSGGARNHPAAIVFVGVRPDFKEGRVFIGWRGDGLTTTSGDVLQKFQDLKGRMKPVAQYYDWAARDFFTIASRIGEPFQAADKSHELGEQVVNVLFKNDMLKIYDTPELRKLMQELESVRISQDKTKAKDDFCDALRYAISKIPWDFSGLGKRYEQAKKADPRSDREKFYKGANEDEAVNDGLDLIESEFDEANEAYEYYRDEGYG